MADNYLERRMEEHRRARQGAAVKRVKHVTSGLKPGQVAVDYPTLRVLVAGASSPTGEAVIGAFRRFNCRVAFTCDDRAAGARLAQKHGAQYHPGSVDEAVARLAAAGDPVSVIVALSPLVTTSSLPTLIPPQYLIEAGPEVAAAWCIYAAHPLNLPYTANDLCL